MGTNLTQTSVESRSECARDAVPMIFPPVHRARLETLQANLGYRCNQSCNHCHVAAGPRRAESMSWETMQLLLRFARRQEVHTLDLTGGAPEMHPRFRDLVKRARRHGLRVIDRCNLTVLSEPGQETLADFLAAEQVEIIASLPCYLEENVDRQRGRGTFQASLAGLRRLNEWGYGDPGSGLVLNLVFNPAGANLPPPQKTLETEYRYRLGDTYGIRFNQLFTMVNMPIRRFKERLAAQGMLEAYTMQLKAAFQPENLQTLMCRKLLSIDWNGSVFDCDFNQMSAMPLHGVELGGTHLSEWMDRDFVGRMIRVNEHCFGCAAGQGSSCQGALT